MAGAPQFLVAKGQLDEGLRSLLDPRQPVPERVRFFANATPVTTLGVAVAWAVVALALLVLGLLTLRDQIRTADPEGAAHGVAGLVVGVMELLGALACGYRVWRQLDRRRRVAAGLWRDGLFLTPSTLLTCFSDRCTAIPKSAVLRIDETHFASDRGRRTIVVVDVQLPNGEVTGLELEGIAGVSQRELARALREWFDR